MSEKERYATIGTWVEVFKSEGLNISHGGIRKRLSKLEVIGLTARDKTGRLLKNCFFSESVVRQLLTDLFQVGVPVVAENGFFENEGERYSSVKGLSCTLKISENLVKKGIKSGLVRSITVRASGRIRTFYSEADIAEALGAIMQLPQADDDGFIEKDGKRYAAVKTLERLFKVSHPTIKRGVESTNCPSLTGVGKGRRSKIYYLISSLRTYFSERTDDLPQADDEGYIYRNGQRYGTAKSLARILGVSDPTIRKQARVHALPSFRGIEKRGHVVDFYSELDLQRLCADLIAKHKK